jgi:hypothetical protein
MTRLIIILILLITYSTEACQCPVPFPSDFIESVTRYHSDLQPYSIVKGYKISDTLQNGIGCEYKVIQTIYGSTVQDTIKVWGDPGWTCLDKPAYSVGDTTLILIMKVNGNDATMPYLSAGDYVSYRCGFFTLLVKNDSVYGGLVSSFTFNGYDYTSFMDSLNFTLNNLSTSKINYTNKDITIKIYPNPSRDIINLEGDFNSPIDVTISNVLGQNVISEKIWKNTIDISLLKAGTYFINVIGEREYSLKFVKFD